MTNIQATPMKLTNIVKIVENKKFVCSGWGLKTPLGMYSTDGVTPHLFASKRIASRAGSQGLIADGLLTV